MNKFLMSESEKQRILEMHKTAIEKNVIYEAPTATPPPKPGMTANSTTMVKATFNCRYNGNNVVATVSGSFTKLPTGEFKPSDGISVMIGNKPIVQLSLNISDSKYYFNKNNSSAEGLKSINMFILKPKKPYTAVSEVISQINKGAGTQLTLSSDVINAFNKIPSGVELLARTKMPNELTPLSPEATLHRYLDPETGAILNTVLWLGDSSTYEYYKKNGVIKSTGGSGALMWGFKSNPGMADVLEKYKYNTDGLRPTFNALWDTLESKLA